ncbi:MAG TPA: PAS domain S-box protein [Actinomycetota bacterium]|nr:PAS domain S-box protein [Actinomycetota bacterium]
MGTSRVIDLFEPGDPLGLYLARSPDAVSVVRAADLTYRFVNDAYCRLTGRAREELLGSPALLLGGEDLPRRAELAEGLANGGVAADVPFEIGAADGRRVPVLVTAQLVELGGEPHVVTVLRPRDPGAADEVPGVGRARFREVFENAVEGILQTTVDGTIVAANPAAARILGYGSPSELLRAVPNAARLYADPARRAELVERVLAEGAVSGLELEVRRRDGSTGWVAANARLLRGSDARPIGFEVLLTDATERKLAEQALREAEERYRTLVEQIPAVTYVGRVAPTDPPGYVPLYVSPQVLPLFGYTPEEWLTGEEVWARTLHPEDRDRVLAEVERTDRTGEPLSIEYRIVARDGRVVWIHDEAVLVRGADGRPAFWHGVMLDITRQREAEQRLRESLARLEALIEERGRLIQRIGEIQEQERSRLAADLHDDPIQKMTAVGLRIEALRRRTRDPVTAAALDDLAGTVRLTIARLRHLLFDLRPPALDRHGLAPAIRQHLDLLGDELAPEVRLVDELVREPPPGLRTTAFRIVQEALANVRRHAGARAVEIRLAERGGDLHLVVRDDGRGFEPAAVVEEPGHLGLRAMRERAEAAGGRVRIESGPGRGTTVEAWLPVAAEPCGAPGTVGTPPPSSGV